ncbi:hypothetical protein SOPP22_08855 [Shewanella sp. OPT22]|nr:hypothetical protein SOPP22_08855 [Shewanella sp. OPT22]
MSVGKVEAQFIPLDELQQSGSNAPDSVEFEETYLVIGDNTSTSSSFLSLDSWLESDEDSYVPVDAPNEERFLELYNKFNIECEKFRHDYLTSIGLDFCPMVESYELSSTDKYRVAKSLKDSNQTSGPLLVSFTNKQKGIDGGVLIYFVELIGDTVRIAKGSDVNQDARVINQLSSWVEGSSGCENPHLKVSSFSYSKSHNFEN